MQKCKYVVSGILGKVQIQELIDIVDHVEQLDNIDPLMALLTQ